MKRAALLVQRLKGIESRITVVEAGPFHTEKAWIPCFGSFEIDVVVLHLMCLAVEQPIDLLRQRWVPLCLCGDYCAKFGFESFARPVDFARPFIQGAFADAGALCGEVLTWVAAGELFAQFADRFLDDALFFFLLAIFSGSLAVRPGHRRVAPTPEEVK